MNDSLRVIPYNLLGKLIKGKIFIIKLEELLLILDRYGVNLKNYYINVWDVDILKVLFISIVQLPLNLIFVMLAMGNVRLK